MEFPQIDGAADPDSPLGMLQRGRGDGWRHAASHGEGAALLLTCLAHEPRWDGQVECRGNYYATLALRIGVAPAAFGSSMLTMPEDDQWIVDSVLEAMAERGSVEAAELLLESPLRIVEDEQPRSGRRHQTISPENAPIEDLLAAHPRWHARSSVVNRLRTTRDGREVALLREVARQPERPGWALAMRVLSLRGDLTPLDTASRILAADRMGPNRGPAFRYVRQLPRRNALPLAREWIGLDDGRGAAAVFILGEHAELIDLHDVRRVLASARNYYAISSLVSALGRMPEGGPFPELAVVYEESAYSYARARAVEAMAATDRDFGRVRAVECLWDCEADARRVGANHAVLRPLVRQRLRELAADEFEDVDVRSAAAARLRTRLS